MVSPVENYKTWHALEPGGAPHNVFGWMLNWAFQLTVARRDLLSTDFYKAPFDEAEIPKEEWHLHEKSYLNGLFPEGQSLQPREGERVEAAKYVFPQRSVPEVKVAAKEAFERIKQPEFDAFDALESLYPSRVYMAMSQLEKRGPGVFVKHPSKKSPHTPPASAGMTRNEIAHVHRSDGSSHVTLNYPDAMQVIQKGWGERHALSGVKGMMSKGYVFLYPPRNEEELEVVKKIWRASIEFMTANTKLEEGKAAAAPTTASAPAPASTTPAEPTVQPSAVEPVSEPTTEPTANA